MHDGSATLPPLYLTGTLQLSEERRLAAQWRVSRYEPSAAAFRGRSAEGHGVHGAHCVAVQLWLHESERTYCDRLVNLMDAKKYKELALEQAKKFFKEISPPTLMVEPLIFCHFAQGVGDKIYDKINSFPDLSSLLNGALDEYNETNAAMNLVLFEDAMRHVCRVSRIIESSGGHALMVGVGGMGKQSLSKLATYINQYAVFMIVISATYGVNDLRNDLQIMYRRAGVKGEGLSFLFTDSQITDERFLVFMNDLLSSGNIPGLFPPEDMDDIINAVRPAVKRSGIPDTRDNCWDYFINTVRANLHVILCFSPIGDPIKIRTRRFPALVNCVVIDWFQPWPEEALSDVATALKNGEIDMGWVNHYYLHKIRAANPDLKAANYSFSTAGDAGNLMMLSGAALVSHSKNKVDGQKLVDFLLSATAQAYFANNTYEYPTVAGIALHKDVPPIDAQMVRADQSHLTDLTGTLTALRELGLQ